MNEHLEAIEYSMRTLQDNKQTGVIMTRAEEVKAIEKKVRKGGQLTSEDLKIVKAVDGQLLFGYDEKTRLAKLQQVEDVLKKEHSACEEKLKKIQEGFKKARGAEEKEKIKKLYQAQLGERNQITKTIDENRSFASNRLQPPPVIEEVEVNTTQPKVNADLRENQIKIKLTSNDQLRAKGGFVKYTFEYDEGKVFENDFDISKDSEEFVHNFEGIQNLTSYLKTNLLKRKIDIKLKKKVMLYRKTLDEQSIALTQLGSKSVVTKQIKLDGVPIEVEVMLHKSVKSPEMETVKVKKYKVKLIPPPFRTLEEQKSGVARKPQAQPQGTQAQANRQSGQPQQQRASGQVQQQSQQ